MADNNSDPSSEPGGRGAAQRGCTCPVLANNSGEGFEGISNIHIIDPVCPVHAEHGGINQGIIDDYVDYGD